MSHELTIEFLEVKKELLFVGGQALTDLALNQRFNALYQYGSQQTSKKKLATIDLTLKSLIHDGEPAASVSSGETVLAALAGDPDVVLQAAEKLGWRRKSGRTLRTSDAALTLAGD